ncbi:glycosyltransferase [Brachybacterium muris]|uniref:glycosyltransferase n=1 Tax=Brachybacterium muris TaxID=219301 RepID=UPI00223C1A44|nr:glycosyltransferase [Brachybacterium muris]MCT2295513.1 glycosyltransferase [Brachybacterium muris]
MRTPEIENPYLPQVRRVDFVVDSVEGAPLRYRVQTPLAGLERRGVLALVHDAADPGLPGKVVGADAVIVFRVPATRVLARSLVKIREQLPDTILAFDIDDALFDVESNGFAGEAAELAMRYQKTVLLCGRMLGSTEAIGNLAQTQLGVPAAPFRNGVHPAQMELFERARRRPRVPGPVRVAMFDGSGTHGPGLGWLSPAISDLLRSRRHRGVHFWAFGAHSCPEPLGELGRRFHRVPFMDWMDLPMWMRQMDLVLAPNMDNPTIADTKSALKWLEAGAVGVPTLAQATRPYREAVTPNVDGALVEQRTLDAWTEAMDRQLSLPAERRRMGKNAVRSVARHSSEAVADDLLRSLSDLAVSSVPVSSVFPDEASAEGTPLESTPTANPLRSKVPLGRRAILKALAGEARTPTR